MIAFRCWYCNRAYRMPESRIGERITCACKYLLRVPKRSGGSCRVKSLVDRLVEAVVYGGGGGLLGLGLAILILSQAGRFGILARVEETLLFTAGLTAGGFLFGLLGGERGINWIGQLIRHREER
jgi:hypothetical protein